MIIDSDQHLYESRTLWSDYCDPTHAEEALRIEDDDRGFAWLTWRGGRVQMADVQLPGDPVAVGRHRRRWREGLGPEYRYDEALPDDYWEPGARAAKLAELGVDQAVVFPNFGLLWERPLSVSVPALTANMTAWNRWCGEVAATAGDALHPVAHLSLRQPEWLEAELDRLASAGVRLAMIAPAPVDGRPLSHPEHDRIWASFVAHGVTPVFHVADQPRVIDEALYTDPADSFVPVLESVFLWTPAALAVTDLIVNGAFERHPELRIGIVELSSIWVPQYLLMLDGAWDFTTTVNGKPLTELRRRPSEYFRRQVRVSSFSYEQPAALTAQSDDLYMCCSDYPHGEGTATPIADYARAGCEPGQPGGLFADNVATLLGR
ncbi:MAG TPA: amidohydrolase family protein [Acidimicrobiales bacterium]|nr:amidohydrolase family protein [Acidimicrobiales bacterium]